MAKEDETNLSFLCGWKRSESQSITLKENQYTPIVNPKSGEFLGFFVGKEDGIYRCWDPNLRDAERKFSENGYTKVCPNACGVLDFLGKGERINGMSLIRILYQTFLIMKNLA